MITLWDWSGLDGVGEKDEARSCSNKTALKDNQRRFKKGVLKDMLSFEMVEERERYVLIIIKFSS